MNDDRSFWGSCSQMTWINQHTKQARGPRNNEADWGELWLCVAEQRESERVSALGGPRGRGWGGSWSGFLRRAALRRLGPKKIKNQPVVSLMMLEVALSGITFKWLRRKMRFLFIHKPGADNGAINDWGLITSHFCRAQCDAPPFNQD